MEDNMRICREGKITYVLIGDVKLDDVAENCGEYISPTTGEKLDVRRKFLEYMRDCLSMPIKKACEFILPHLYETEDFVGAARSGLNDRARYF